MLAGTMSMQRREKAGETLPDGWRRGVFFLPRIGTCALAEKTAHFHRVVVPHGRNEVMVEVVLSCLNAVEPKASP